MGGKEPPTATRTRGELEEDRRRAVRAEHGARPLVLPAKAIIGNIVFTDDDAYAFYHVPLQSYDFISHTARLVNASRMVNALAALVDEDGADEREFLFVSTSTPMNLEAWVEQVVEENAKYNEDQSAFFTLVEEEFSMMAEHQFSERKSFLGVRLGSRRDFDIGKMNVIEHGVRSAFRYMSKRLRAAFNGVADVTEDEEMMFTAREKAIHNTINTGGINGERCTPLEILVFTKAMLSPALPIVRPESEPGHRVGEGEIITAVSDFTVENHMRYLKFVRDYDGEEMEGYRSVLSLTEFPKIMDYPIVAPFLYMPALNRLPFTVYSRFKLVPKKKMDQKAKRASIRSEDEIENMSEGRSETNALVNGLGADFEESLSDINLMKEILATNRDPWVVGSYRVVVEASTLDNMNRLVQFLRQEYKNMGIVVRQGLGTQARMLTECLPGGAPASRQFEQITSLSALAAAGIHFGNSVGDPIRGIGL